MEVGMMIQQTLKGETAVGMKIQIVIISVHVRKIVRLPPTPGGGKGVKERVGVGGGGVGFLCCRTSILGY